MKFYKNHPLLLNLDPDLRNIIDVLSQFVAKNGVEFEQITKQKQKDNPKFQFLFGGDYYNYYQFKVNGERLLLRQKSMEQHLNQQSNLMNLSSIHHHQSITPPSMPPPIYSQSPLNQFNNIMQQQQAQLPSVSAALVHQQQQQQKTQNQINSLQDQIRQSLDNLNAQHQMLINQQQLLIDEAIRKIQDEKLAKLAHDFNINLHEFELILQPIFETCTKDSISAGKNWISTRCHLPMQFDIICKYFLKRIRSKNSMADVHKLHLLYLINDLFNHWYVFRL